MASKVKMKSFNKKVEKIVLGFGGELLYDSEYRKQWNLKTKAGDLSVTVQAPEASKLFSIFCCFDDVDKAVKVLSPFNAMNLNKHSGKWNYHCLDEQECLGSFTSSLKEIL